MIKLLHILSEVIQERSQTTTRKVRDILVSKDPQKIRPGKVLNRVYAPNVSVEEFEKLIKSNYDTDVKVLNPGEKGSLSSKFKTFAFDVNGEPVSIVLASGVIAGAAGEAAEVSRLQDEIEQHGSVSIEAAGVVHKDIVKIEKVPGNKKADFQLINSSGKPVIFIQHKSPTHQQMSGISKLSKTDFPEIAAFVDKVKASMQPGDTRLTQRVTEPVKDPKLKQLATYGTLNASFGPNAVQLYCVGELSLKKEGDVFKVKGSAKTFEYPEELPNDYQPTLMARYATGRNQEGISNIRIGIYPKNVQND